MTKIAPFKKIFFASSLIILLLISIGCKEKIKQTDDRYDIRQQTLQLSKSTLEASLELNNSNLNKKIQLENFDTEEKTTFEKIVGKGNKLVFQYSELNCNTCVDSAIIDLKKMESKIGAKNLIIIAASENRRYMANFIRLNVLKGKNIYLITPSDYENFYKYPINSPFLFITDSSTKIIDVFIPIKEIPGLSSIYYDVIYRKYFNLKSNNNGGSK